jgi:predicted nucleic acid-binding protein
VIGPALLDNSAWARFEHASLSAARKEEIAAALEAERLVVCLPFLLEAGYSARGPREYDRLFSNLLELPRVEIDETVEAHALEVQQQLARVGHHRLAPMDVMIAALADRHEVGVLHYDGDYDLLADKTDLRFESVWLAQRGSL